MWSVTGERAHETSLPLSKSAQVLTQCSKIDHIALLSCHRAWRSLTSISCRCALEGVVFFCSHPHHAANIQRCTPEAVALILFQDRIFRQQRCRQTAQSAAAFARLQPSPSTAARPHGAPPGRCRSGVPPGGMPGALRPGGQRRPAGVAARVRRRAFAAPEALLPPDESILLVKVYFLTSAVPLLAGVSTIRWRCGDLSMLAARACRRSEALSGVRHGSNQAGACSCCVVRPLLF